MREKATPPRLVTLEEQWHAIDLVTAAAPSPSDPQLRRRISKIWRSTTPHELWRASGGLAGDKRRGDWAAWRGAVYRVVAIVPLGLAALWVLAWGLRAYYNGH